MDASLKLHAILQNELKLSSNEIGNLFFTDNGNIYLNNSINGKIKISNIQLLDNEIELNRISNKDLSLNSLYIMRNSPDHYMYICIKDNNDNNTLVNIINPELKYNMYYLRMNIFYIDRENIDGFGLYPSLFIKISEYNDFNRKLKEGYYNNTNNNNINVVISFNIGLYPYLDDIYTDYNIPTYAKSGLLCSFPYNGENKKYMFELSRADWTGGANIYQIIGKIEDNLIPGNIRPLKIYFNI